MLSIRCVNEIKRPKNEEKRNIGGRYLGFEVMTPTRPPPHSKIRGDATAIKNQKVCVCCPLFFFRWGPLTFLFSLFLLFYFIFPLRSEGGGVSAPVPPPLWIRPCSPTRGAQTHHTAFLFETEVDKSPFFRLSGIGLVCNDYCR